MVKEKGNVKGKAPVLN